MEHPTREECERLLEEYGTPQHVRAHCREVARTAYIVAKALNDKGYELDLNLILAAGLLHDIARVEENHGEAGARLMESFGYTQEAAIIRVHMRYSPFSAVDKINETDMVCLGDRLVREDQYVGLDARIDYIIDKIRKNGHAEAVPIIMKKKSDTVGFLEGIKQVIGISVDKLMQEHSEKFPEKCGEMDAGECSSRKGAA